ncbi:hypothetical protein KR018_012243, partial [Drosophila ironensis]
WSRTAIPTLANRTPTRATTTSTCWRTLKSQWRIRYKRRRRPTSRWPGMQPIAK